jgi:hypothetical protein
LSTYTTEIVTDPKTKGRVVTAMGRHLDWEAETIQAMEKEPLVSDGDGCE